MTGWIGIALGDVTGIGLEVTLKALAKLPADDSTRYLLIGDEGYVRRTNDQLRLGLQFGTDRSDPTQQFILHNPGETLPDFLIQGSPTAARAALNWLSVGALQCLKQELDALVTAPLSKASIIQTGTPFIGQTEFLSQLAGTERSGMMLLGHDEVGRWLRVVLVTTHVPLELVARSLTQAKVELAIELAAEACQKLQLPKARIGVCGLNPHAGEGGELGLEEQTIIMPAVQRMQERGVDVEGPLSADTLFYSAFHGEYDLIVAMYHDQGLCPLKMIGFETGVNWTLGLPFIRTSPDHGTAFNIYGQNRANPASMMNALKLARELVQRETMALARNS